MKLYTINATPVREDLERHVNTGRCHEYPEFVAKILKGYLIDGFTIYPVQGYWQGKAEPSFKIEIAVDPATIEGKGYNIINSICEELRDTFNQDAVMLTNPDNSVEFI